ncbi:hypothetical protein GGR58DRAFT_453755 [Xylaria digitata]|nr:hypothetical protein GGR58DRAFT_453755 [Xylaria digitata]
MPNCLLISLNDTPHAGTTVNLRHQKDRGKVFFTTLDSPDIAMKTWFASPGGSVIPGTRWKQSCASTEDMPPRNKN